MIAMLMAKLASAGAGDADANIEAVEFHDGLRYREDSCINRSDGKTGLLGTSGGILTLRIASNLTDQVFGGT